MQYQINITIDEAGLKYIYQSGYYVTLAQVVESWVMSTSALPPGPLPVAWLSFPPLELNQVIWTSQYYLFATTTVLQTGAIIMINSRTASPAQPGWQYQFSNGYFTGQYQPGSDGYNVTNLMCRDNLSFGLAQQATLNNASVCAPVNTVPVLYNEQAGFTPQNNIGVFLSSCSSGGIIIDTLPDNALAVQLTAAQPVANVGFNDATKAFYLQ